jgi:cell division protein FtsN
MNHRVTGSILVLAIATACGGDEAPQSLQSDSPAAQPLASTPAPAPTGTAGTTGATGSGTGTKAPSQPAGAVQRDPAADVAARDAAELQSAQRLRTVQVGSFLNAATAEALRARLERDGLPVWTATTRYAGEDFTRVRVGVATNGAEARTLAEKIRAQYKWPVWITLVENRAQVPANALTATRSFTGR